MTDKEKQIARIKEYNEKYYPLINNTSIILHSFDHAIKKAGAYNEVMKQLKILGWNDEWKSFIIAAVRYYADFLKGKHEIPDGSVVLSKEEYAELKQAKSLLEFREETIKYLEDANIRYAKALELKVNEKERKETAREILEAIKLKAWGNNADVHGKIWSYSTSIYALAEIAKQFGVEVEE